MDYSKYFKASHTASMLLKTSRDCVLTSERLLLRSRYLHSNFEKILFGVISMKLVLHYEEYSHGILKT